MSEKKNSLVSEADAMRKIGQEFEALLPDARLRVLHWLSSVVNGGSGQNVSLQSTSPSPTPTQGTPLPNLSQGKDIKSFWKEKVAKNNYEKLAVLGYFLEYEKGLEEFGKEDLRALWKDTREACPTEQVLTNSINSTMSTYQYFVQGSQERRYRMSSRGQRLVETMPNAEKDLLGAARKKKVKKAKSKL